MLKLIWKIICAYFGNIYLYSWYLVSMIGYEKRKARYDAHRASLTQEERDKADAEAAVYFARIKKEIDGV